jgi:hypothetical protein
MFHSDKYLSVKWLKGGRVYPELDCFGIINEIRGDLLLPLWPDFSGVTKDEGGLDREARKFMNPSHAVSLVSGPGCLLFRINRDACWYRCFAGWPVAG